MAPVSCATDVQTLILTMRSRQFQFVLISSVFVVVTYDSDSVCLGQRRSRQVKSLFNVPSGNFEMHCGEARVFFPFGWLKSWHGHFYHQKELQCRPCSCLQGRPLRQFPVKFWDLELLHAWTKDHCVWLSPVLCIESSMEAGECCTAQLWNGSDCLIVFGVPREIAVRDAAVNF